MRILGPLLLLLTFAACERDAHGTRAGKMRVVATTGMVADLARVVGGERAEVDALMGPGVDPHLYSASAGDLDRLRGADLILYSGCLLEGKMTDIFTALARKKPVFAVTERIPKERLLEPPELQGHFDPHVWFDVSLWAETPAAVAEALAEVDPAHAEEYRARAGAYRDELLALHAEVKEALATIPKERRVLVTSHDAFRYFGRAYDVEVRGLQGVSTALDAGVKDVQDMVELICARGIRAIFVETSVSPAAIEAVRKWVEEKGQSVRIGGRLYSDAMGDHPPEDTYPGMVRKNVAMIVEALR
jgi:manganese/zinc/iron transport system substrate-binding protein